MLKLHLILQEIRRWPASLLKLEKHHRCDKVYLLSFLSSGLIAGLEMYLYCF